ncbi:MAG: hypothetical protein Q4D06_05965 [Coriobacteriia bacterium]|nr:hypothetical protein [Coriobacteriia bacterium]
MIQGISQRMVRTAAVCALVLGAMGLVAATSTQAHARTYVDQLTSNAVYVNCDMPTAEHSKIVSIEQSAPFAGETAFTKASWAAVGDTNRIKIKDLKPGRFYEFRITYTFTDSSGTTTSEWNVSGKTVPTKPTQVKLADQLYGSKKLRVSFKTSVCDGYTVKLDPVKSGLSTRTITEDFDSDKTRVIKSAYKTASQNTAYLTSVRTWVEDDKGKRYYSAWSTKVRLLPQPVLNKVKAVSGGMRLYWNKISGATSYTLYTSTTKGSWSKVGTYKGTQKVVKSIKGRAFQKKRTYYALVVANYGSTSKSPKVLYTGFRKN